MENQDDANAPLPAIISTIANSDEFLAELGDTTISLTNEGSVFEKVPIVGWAVSILKTRDSFQKFRLKRNCLAFMQELAKCPKADLESFRKKLEMAGAAAEEFADTTFAILLDSEKPIKAEYYGRLLRARISGRLEQQHFEQLALIIQAGSVPALNALGLYLKSTGGIPYSQTMMVPEEPLLFSLGIASRNGTKFSISELGIRLADVILKPSE